MQGKYPNYFKDKTKEDKAFIVAEWQQAFSREDDQIFLLAATYVVNRSKYFPNVEEMREYLRKAQTEHDFERRQEEYRRKRLYHTANLTDEDIKLLDTVDSFFINDRIDWKAEREKARKEIGGNLCLEQN